MARFGVLLIFCSLFFTALITQGREILEAGQVFWDGDILQSPGKLFQLKFFTPEFSKSSYLGIQKQGNIGETETVFIWVANRDKPLIDHSGVLNLTSDGFLMIYHDGGSILLNPEHKAVDSVGNFTLGILDSGNLVLRKKDVIWQSFDYPTDSLLPGMKLGLFDLKSEKPRQQSLVSWLSPFVPASGAFTLGVDPNNTEQMVIWRRGRVYWQGRDLNNTMEILSFTISPYAYLFDYVSNENESYFTLSRDQGIRFAWISMNSSGTINRFVEMEQLIPGSAAMTYGPLYAKGYSQFDLCDRKYKYRSSPNDDYCVMVNSANCSNGDKFVHRFGYLDVWTVIIYNSSLSISDCGEICRSNCSCTAYATSLLNGTGCMPSTSENFKRTEDGKDSFFYIRKRVMDRALRRSLWQFIVFPVIALIFLALIISCGIWVLRGKNGNQKNKPKLAIEETTRSNKIGSGEKDHDLPLFKFSTVESATGNFSIENKLGQGGFGPVYKGKLENGQEIAVKRLCRSSGQGIEEFENEVILISKLQHRNLVKLLGFCTQVDEKLLIYEYLPNKSLDSFLFDSTKRLALDWRKRFCIIEGIAQGLLYLHKYSRLRIIHRDLKTSNILLDRDLNPKISDFGLARAFGEDESRANTMNIAGTRGYMSPEYAMGGLISVKSDVFSYGVMILEIISGKKNASFHYENRFLNLLGYAWDLWKEERALELMDPGLLEEHSLPIEVARCVQIGLLCVQENAADRPTMSEVMLFLNNEMLILPVPKKPAFFTVVTTSEEEEKTEQVWPCSVNEVTISNVSGR